MTHIEGFVLSCATAHNTHLYMNHEVGPVNQRPPRPHESGEGARAVVHLSQEGRPAGLARGGKEGSVDRGGVGCVSVCEELVIGS